MKKLAEYIHWVGFIGTCFMLVLSVLDPSRDELVIHFIASLIPNTLSWLLATMIDGKRNYFPVLKG